MAILSALHLRVEDGAQPSIRQKRNGIVHISIPSADHHPQHLNMALDINNLRIVLSRVQNHWKIEGTLTVSVPVLFCNTLIKLIDMIYKLN